MVFAPIPYPVSVDEDSATFFGKLGGFVTDKFETYQRAIARILDSQQSVQGAGFLFSHRYVFTCAHVIIQILGLQAENFRETPKDWIDLDFSNCRTHPKRRAKVTIWKPCLLYFSTVLKEAKVGEDIALLELETPLDSKELEPLPLMPEASPWGHPFRVYGFPTGYDYGTSTEGEVLSRQGCRWWQLKVNLDRPPIEGGFSGAPLWDVEAESVIGMIVAAEDYDGKSNRAKEMGYAIPTSVLQEVWLKRGRLLELLQSFGETLEKPIARAYQACRPPDWNGMQPGTLAEIVSSLNDLDTDYSPEQKSPFLVQFAVHLGKCQEISNLQCLQLQTWVEETFKIKPEEFAQMCDRVSNANKTEGKPALSCSLLISIHAPEVRDRYTIRAWLLKDSETQSLPSIEEHPELLNDETEYLASGLITQMPETVAALLDRVLEDLESELQLEIFLPFELLYLAPDTWEYEKDYDSAKPIGSHYPVLLRVWDRWGYKKPYKKAFATQWQQRWKRIEQYSSQCCSSVLVCGDRADDEIGMDWEKTNAIGLRTRKVPFREKGGFFSFLMTEGVPIALWCRQDLETCCDGEKYEQLLQGCLSELPRKLTILRKAPRDRDRVSHHLSLLWDNPYRVPPDAPSFRSNSL